MNDDSPFEPGKEGVFLNLPERIYRDAPGENISALKTLAESAKKYQWALTHPTTSTPAMIAGTVIHFLTLQPTRPESECFLMRPPQWKDWRTKESQAWRDEQLLPVIDDATLGSAKAAANAIFSHPRAAWMLERCQTEISIFRKHARTGLLLKGRIDIAFQDLENKTAIADLKKVQSVKLPLFERAIGERLYHAQAAFYTDLIGASSFYFIAVEESAPNEVDIFEMEPDGEGSLAEGRRLYEALLDRLAKCRKENRWPGIGEGSATIRRVKAPRFAYTADTIGE